jgi:membrane protein implicated in regulation of membrane protease activity
MNFDDLGIDPEWWWLIGAAVLGIAEIVVPGVFLIWLAAAAAITGLAALLGVPLAFQFGLFALLAIAAVILGKRWYAAHPVESSDPLLNDRAARLIGETLIVASAIEHGQGRVIVGDGVWSAKGPDAPQGSLVRVTGARGGCLTVEPISALDAPKLD